MFRIVSKFEHDRVNAQLLAFQELSKNVALADQLIDDLEKARLQNLVHEKDNARFPIFAKLISLSAKLEQNRKRDAERSWHTEGIAKFSDLVRHELSGEVSCHNLLKHIVKYLSANQGSIFLVEDEDTNNPILHLNACYAYDRRKYVNKKIDIGEGLLGQCFLEKTPIYITDVPPDYIHITSGLGYALPSAIVIVPFIVNGKISAILELASFEVFQPYQIEFLKYIGELIASALESIKSINHTKKLLDIANQQSEELKAQEEEMMQSMEELKATQEEMARKNSEISDLLGQSTESQRLLSEKIAEIERIKMDEEIRIQKIQANQKSIMEKTITRFKDKEVRYLQTIEILQKELNINSNYKSTAVL